MHEPRFAAAEPLPQQADRGAYKCQDVVGAACAARYYFSSRQSVRLISWALKLFVGARSVAITSLVVVAAGHV
jgi:hypothetical protein